MSASNLLRLYPTAQRPNSLAATINVQNTQHSPARWRRCMRIGVGIVLLSVLATGCGPPVSQNSTDVPTVIIDTPTLPTKPDQPVVSEMVTVTVPRDLRATWVHLFDDTLKTLAGVNAMVADAADSGVNLLIVQVARRHDAYYRSSVLPRTTDGAVDDGFDVLAAVLAAAKPRGIHVHAWYGIAPTWHAVYEQLDRPKGVWIATDHGVSAPVEDRWVTRTYDGSWSDYLDLGVPAVKRHVLAVVDELLQNYAIDGIHLDYARYSGIQTGYNPLALAAFAAHSGSNVIPNPNDPAFVAFRRDRVTELVREVHALTQAKGVVLSAAVISWGAPPIGGVLGATRTGTEALQAWDEWLQEGILDLAFPMNYFRAHRSEQADWFAGWLAYQQALDATVSGHIASGVGGYLNDVNDTLHQLDAAIASTGSVALYSWQQPTNGDMSWLRAQLATNGWDQSGGR